ncbi:T9SS type A sorting domain-containing protein [Fluviicola taffensis]|uniref:T9SS type A sorting domain-containing protein n=1 Tax=Fluviicola taffensis TaxID=191579 RepID=UPI003137FB4C
MKIVLLLCSAIFSFSNLFSQISTFPYSNQFETASEMTSWSAVAVSGANQWQIGQPNFGAFSSAHSPINAWVTNLTGDMAPNTTCYIQTPEFDLSDVTHPKILSFYHAMQGGNIMRKLEYSLDGGTTWNLLINAGSPSYNWQTAAAGFYSSSSAFQYSVISLAFLQGSPSVTFRFLAQNNMASLRGWMIDDFVIRDQQIDLTATPDLPILGLSPNFTEFTVKYNRIYTGEYNQGINFQTAYYWSNDTILDAGDISLGHEGQFVLTTNTILLTKILPLPQGLNPGTYYVFYVLDTSNVVQEYNELNNANFTRVEVDPIFQVLDDDFEGGSFWKIQSVGSPEPWHLGDPNGSYSENAHSGDSCWFQDLNPNLAINALTIESPYVDLTGSPSNSICFWYKSYHYNLAVVMPGIQGPTVSYPIFGSSISTTPLPRLDGWECHCTDLAAYSTQASTKIRIQGLNAQSWYNTAMIDRSAIDDIYIGPTKCDASIEKELLHRFMPNSLTIDTLHYHLFNSGLADLPPTETHFYWSNDSILDSGDTDLGSNFEPQVGDTTFVSRTFTFTKPTTVPGNYYIFFKTDANQVADEMREWNNEGYFEFAMDSLRSLPYENDFENNISGWSSTSSLFENDWNWGAANGNGNTLDTCFSGNKAFITNSNGNKLSSFSRSHLFSPVYNLAELANPVLEFDLLADMHNSTSNQSLATILYSVDGGMNWKALLPLNESYKEMMRQTTYDPLVGVDGNNLTYSIIQSAPGYIGFTNHEMAFIADNDEYQSRLYDDHTHYAMDLKPLGDQFIQFMFATNVLVNTDSLELEGLLLDNFKITEKKIDLMIPTQKKIMASGTDKYLGFYFHVKNNENYISNPSQLKVYLSVDTILNAADNLVATKSLNAIKPFEKKIVGIRKQMPASYSSYNYVICQIDPLNANTESNETNNFHVFDLAMDSNVNYHYPLHYQFEETYIDGWNQYNDSTGYSDGTFRTQLVTGDYVTDAASGEWFMDYMNVWGSGWQNLYSIYYLESPSYNFSHVDQLKIEFDFRSFGTQANSPSENGSNLSYSIDGGNTWSVLTANQLTQALNWYNSPNIPNLDQQPGWGLIPNWTHASAEMSFLEGQQNVKFRFAQRANYNNGGMLTGFRMDNFKINGRTFDLEAYNEPEIYIPMIPSSFNTQYSIANLGNSNLPSAVTTFFWSTDSIFDTGDSYANQFTDGPLPVGDTATFSRFVSLPNPIQQATYYLFHRVDGVWAYNETNELNNEGRMKVIIDTTGLGLKNPENSFVKIYPNPAENLLFVETNKESSVELIGLDGTLIYQDEISAHHQIDVSHLQSGIYFVRIGGSNYKWTKL